MSQCHTVASFILLCLCYHINSQPFVSVNTIDDFSVDTKSIVAYPSGIVNTPVYAQTTSPTILGSARVIELKVVYGAPKSFSSLDAQVTAGFFNANGGVEPVYGYTVLIYDGSTGNQINPAGLFGANNTDFTVGNATALHLNIKSNGDTQCNITVYSGSLDDSCTIKTDIIGNPNAIDYFLRYTDFTTVGQGCDFTNVGAITFEFDVGVEEYLYVDIIEVVNLPPPATVYTIDNFEAAPKSLTIRVPPGGVPAGGMNDYGSGFGPSIVGGERDMQLYIYQGTQYEIAYAEIYYGNFSCAVQGFMTGITVLQYDGSDASPTLQPNGLGGLNFTANYGYAFEFGIYSNVETLLTLYVYSGSTTSYCVHTIELPADQYNDYIISFSEFQVAPGGGCNFSSVGAVQLEISVVKDMTVHMSYFDVIS